MGPKCRMWKFGVYVAMRPRYTLQVHRSALCPVVIRSLQGPQCQDPPHRY